MIFQLKLLFLKLCKVVNIKLNPKEKYILMILFILLMHRLICKSQLIFKKKKPYKIYQFISQKLK